MQTGSLHCQLADGANMFVMGMLEDSESRT